MSKDRNLVYGLMAIAMRKVSARRLRELSAKTPGVPPADIGLNLVDSGDLTPEEHATLNSLVDEALNRHGGDAKGTIHSLSQDPDFLPNLTISLTGQESKAPNMDTLGLPMDAQGIEDSIFGGGEGVSRTVASDDGGGLQGRDAPDSLVSGFGSSASNYAGDSGFAPTIQSQSDGSVDQSLAATRATDAPHITQVHTERPEDDDLVPAVEEHRGRYRKIKDFAAGGMGKITLMHDTHLGRDIALKQLLANRLNIETKPGAPTTQLLTVPIIARFLQEARITGQLEHPSIIPVYELGYRADGSLYYTMKFVRGHSMQDALKETSNLQERMQILPHFLDLCNAMAYAHSRKVIHRDLKPMNVMIGEFGETLVIDWGIAKVKGERDIHQKEVEENVRVLTLSEAEQSQKTMAGQTIGSPYFMPPEQAQGQIDLIDERSDVYALGAILYTILAGKPPYSGMNVREFIHSVGAVKPKPIADLEPMAPKELIAVVNQALEPDPMRRYQTAKELTDEVKEYLSGGLVSAYDYKFSELARRFVKKHRRVLVTAAAGIVVLVAGGIYSYIQIRAEKNFAEEQRDIAVVAKQEAVEAKDEAEEQRGIALVERDNAEVKLYQANVSRGQSAINEQQMDEARSYLEEAPVKYRNWEWGHLEALAHADLMTLEKGGRFVAFAGDSIIAGSKAGTLLKQDLKTGETLHTFVDQSGLGFAAEISEDGSRLAARGDAALTVWNTADGAVLFNFDQPEADTSQHFAALSADGTRVATLNSDKTVKVWAVDGGAEIFSTSVQQVQGFGIYLSPAGDTLLLVKNDFGDEGWQRVFEGYHLPEGTLIGRTIVPDPNSIKAAAFSPDGTRLVLGSDQILFFWDVANWTEVRQVPKWPIQVTGTVAFSPDGKWVAAGSTDGSLGLWEFGASGQEKIIEAAHENWVRAVSFSHSGEQLVSVGDDRTARVWQAPTLVEQRKLRGHGGSLFVGAFSEDDQLLATGAFDGRTKLWDFSAELEFTTNLKNLVHHKATNRVAGSEGNTAWIWDARSGHRIAELAGHGELIKSLDFSPSGEGVVTIAQEGGEDRLILWNSATGEQIASAGLPGSNAVALDMGTESLVSVGSTKISIVDMSSGAVVYEQDGAEKIVWSDSGDLAAILSAKNGETNSSALQVFKTAPWEKSFETAIPRPEGRVVVEVQLAFTPDSTRLLATHVDNSERGRYRDILHSYDLATGEAGPVFDGHTDRINAMAFNGGALLATAGKDNVIMLWDLNAGTALGTLRGHAGEVKDIAFNRDGSRLASASGDGTFKLWDVNKQVAALTLQSAARTAAGSVMPSGVSFSANDLQLVTRTHPPVPPFVLHAFETDLSVYPGTADTPLEERMEGYKRNYWRP